RNGRAGIRRQRTPDRAVAGDRLAGVANERSADAEDVEDGIGPAEVHEGAARDRRAAREREAAVADGGVAAVAAAVGEHEHTGAGLDQTAAAAERGEVGGGGAAGFEHSRAAKAQAAAQRGDAALVADAGVHAVAVDGENLREVIAPAAGREEVERRAGADGERARRIAHGA